MEIRHPFNIIADDMERARLGAPVSVPNQREAVPVKEPFRDLLEESNAGISSLAADNVAPRQRPSGLPGFLEAPIADEATWNVDLERQSMAVIEAALAKAGINATSATYFEQAVLSPVGGYRNRLIQLDLGGGNQLYLGAELAARSPDAVLADINRALGRPVEV